jgi:hypothetical protein
MEDKNKPIVEKLIKAIFEVGAFAADKRNTDQKYDYISADQVIERGGQALAKQGLVILAAVTDSTVTITPRGEAGKFRYDVVIKFVMTVTDGESSLVEEWMGYGSDFVSPDKAGYKAQTSGHKYYMMKLLQISIGNTDSEHEEEPKEKEGSATSIKKKSLKDDPRMKEVIALAVQYGGSKNTKVMELMAKYADKGNPNSIKDEKVLDKLLAELKSPENIALLVANTPKAESTADSQKSE